MVATVWTHVNSSTGTFFYFIFMHKIKYLTSKCSCANNSWTWVITCNQPPVNYIQYAQNRKLTVQNSQRERTPETVRMCCGSVLLQARKSHFRGQRSHEIKITESLESFAQSRFSFAFLTNAGPLSFLSRLVWRGCLETVSRALISSPDGIL